MIRSLTECERTITTSLLTAAGLKAENFHSQAEILVKVLDDGGMGSLEFVAQNDDRTFGKAASQCSFFDDDGIEVIITLNLDQRGEPYELDVWKTDHSQLINLENALNSKCEVV